MGAETFTNIVRDEPDVSKAFDAAVTQAQYDHGHAGYSGTIAEKQEYVIISDHVFSSQEEAEERAERLMDKDDPRISDKWGPAGAIAFKDADGKTGWIFFGWASS